MKSILNIKRYALAVVAVTIMAGFMAFLPGKINSTPKAEAAGLSTSAQNLAGLIAVDRITNGSGSTSMDSLGNLLVLNGLFGTSNSTQSTKDLAGLLAVDRSVGSNGTTGTTGTTNESLGNLLVLNGLFGSGGTTTSGISSSAQNLAGLIAVDRITGGNSGTTGSDSLGNLIVLHNLFNN